ncbi:hypothetical protein ES703_115552 [subsurface metagenome]
MLDQYSSYLENLKDFINNYVLSAESSNYFYLKNEVMDELGVITNNLQNLSSNIRNIKRITKNSTGINDSLLRIEELLREMTHLGSKMQDSIEEIKSIHEDTIYLWFEINKIKNLKFKLNEIPGSLENCFDTLDMNCILRAKMLHINSDMYSHKKGK